MQASEYIIANLFAGCSLTHKRESVENERNVKGELVQYLSIARIIP
jgi:hypothetical protein